MHKGFVRGQRRHALVEQDWTAAHEQVWCVLDADDAALLCGVMSQHLQRLFSQRQLREGQHF